MSFELGKGGEGNTNDFVGGNATGTFLGYFKKKIFFG